MVASLDGPFLKLDRALANIHALNGEILAFRSVETHQLAADRDADTGERLIRLRPVTTPERFWPVMIGEIVHDLRSALDHLVWQLACTAVGEPDVTHPLPSWWSNLQFPICRTKEDFNKAVKYKRLWNLDVSDVDLIRREQPYVTSRTDPEADLLWRLSQLSNIDKHRTLHLTSPFLMCYADTPCVSLSATNGTITDVWTASSGPINDDEVIARYRITPGSPTPEVEARSQFLLEITLAEPSPLAGWAIPLAGALVAIRGRVEALVCQFQHRFPGIADYRHPQAVLLDARTGPVQLT